VGYIYYIGWINGYIIGRNYGREIRDLPSRKGADVSTDSIYYAALFDGCVGKTSIIVSWSFYARMFSFKEPYGECRLWLCVLPKHDLYRRAFASLFAAAQGPDEKREEPVFPPVAGEDKVIEGWVLQPEGPSLEGLHGTGAEADGDARVCLYALGLAGGLARSKVDLVFMSKEEDGHRP